MIPTYISRFWGVSAALAVIALSPVTASAQSGSNPGWFVPGQQRSAGPAAPSPQRAPAPAMPGFGNDTSGQGGDPQAQPQVQVQLPPMPEIPQVDKGPPPPAAVIGVLSVPDVHRLSNAYQAMVKELATRRQKSSEDAQRDLVPLRELVEALRRDRAKMAPEQIRSKEREYEERLNESRRKYGERDRILQETYQYGLAQIDRVVEQVAQRVAASRGVNIVVYREQLLGTTPEFELTVQVADVLNKVMASVVIPPEGISVAAIAPKVGGTAPGSITVPPSAPVSVPLVLPPAPANPPPKR